MPWFTLAHQFCFVAMSHTSILDRREASAGRGGDVLLGRIPGPPNPAWERSCSANPPGGGGGGWAAM